ncbi:MAG: hypothetical protein QM657_05485 [Lacrimispora sp.]|uniref:hypothetical protein n=1 Tax=Lacrimispora sp. TaxID=2719234 RepID=UPI0039E560A5
MQFKTIFLILPAKNTVSHRRVTVFFTGRHEDIHEKCLCLVEFDGVQKIEPPLAFDHQGNMDDWLIIDKIEDMVVGTSIPYNYENSRF